MTEVNADLIARFREKKFVPDRRSDGWWTTNVVKYLGPSNNPFHDCMLLCQARETFSQEVYCRYRFYYFELKILMISVREEDVDHVHKALYNYVQEIPKPEHFTATRIYWESAPIFVDLYDITNDYLFKRDARKILAKRDLRTPKERVQFNMVVDNITHIAKRFLLDFPERGVRDELLRRMCHGNLVHPTATSTDRKWLAYQNIWALSEKIDEICPRTVAEGNPVLEKYFPVTREEFERFLIDHPEDVPRGHRNNESIDDSAQVVPDNTTDNDLLKNIDVVRGRGMYLSHSRTYENWTPQESEGRIVVEASTSR